MSERYIAPHEIEQREGNEMLRRMEQEMFELADGEKARATLLTVSPAADVRLDVDHAFVERGIDPNGLLIDQARTREFWGRPAGRTPEEFLTTYPEGSMAVCPSNWGWQYGSFEVRNGQVLIDPNDPTLTGAFTVIQHADGAWSTAEISLLNGQVAPDSREAVSRMAIGLSMPLLGRNGEAVNPNEYITDVRLLADVRNYANFAPNVAMPGEFWVLLRKVLPSQRHEAKRIARGDRVVVRHQESLTNDEVTRLQQMIQDYGLGDYLHLDMRRGEPRFAVISPLPLIRIPVVGIGVTENGSLQVACIDGRQEGSAGMTLQEMAEYMLAKGSVDVGLGCAGGDVALVEKTSNGFRSHNVPANRTAEGEHITRPLPSVLIVPPGS